MGVTHDTLFQEVPIVVKNSHLVNELLLELSEEIPASVDSTGVGSAFMDLGCANVLEEQLKHLMLTVDELNQEAIKYNKYQNIALKQCQEKARWAAKRQQDNNPGQPVARTHYPMRTSTKCSSPPHPPQSLTPSSSQARHSPPHRTCRSSARKPWQNGSSPTRFRKRG